MGFQATLDPNLSPYSPSAITPLTSHFKASRK